IIQNISGGDLKSFQELYRSYAGVVRGVLFKMVPSNQIDDLVQEAFVKIWKGLPGFKGESGLKVWIYRIAYRVAVDFLRKGNLQSSQELGEDLPADSAESPVLERNLVRGLLQTFDPDHRTVLVLYFMEECSLQEIAQIVDVPLGTVKSRLFYAKQK